MVQAFTTRDLNPVKFVFPGPSHGRDGTFFCRACRVVADVRATVSLGTGTAGECPPAPLIRKHVCASAPRRCPSASSSRASCNEGWSSYCFALFRVSTDEAGPAGRCHLLCCSLVLLCQGRREAWRVRAAAWLLGRGGGPSGEAGGAARRGASSGRDWPNQGHDKRTGTSPAIMEPRQRKRTEKVRPPSVKVRLRYEILPAWASR